MMDNTLSIAQVLNYVNSLHEQCRNMVRDTVRLLRDNHQIYLSHQKGWDYAKKPNDRFLEQDYSMTRRTWSTFVPSGDIRRGAIFCFDFFHPQVFVAPSLIFGAVDPGDGGFDSVDRWATWNIVVEAEKGEKTVTVSHDGPLAIVKGAMPKRYEESTLVRVPLEAVTDQQVLYQILVAPLSALLKGERAAAVELLSGVPTELWPSVQTGPTDEEEDDSEQA